MRHENETFRCQSCGAILGYSGSITARRTGQGIALYACENDDCDNFGIRRIQL